MVKSHFQQMRISFITLGCKLNYAETSTYERAFLKAGFEAVPWNSDNVDVYLVNTCTVTEHSDKKSRNIIRKLHRKNPSAQIIVTGCYAQLKKAEIQSIEGVTHVFGAAEKPLVVPTVLNCVPEGGCGNFFPAYSSGERTRSFLKVQDGCDFKCNYCTVPYARGESRNMPIRDIIPLAREIAAEGIREIVITGVNTGDFGKSTGETFLQLIKELDKVDGIERYRISSIEPNLLTEECVDWIAGSRAFLPHFHIPLQSGCDAVLKEMGRHYLTADFDHKISYIRKKMGPYVFFGIDVIVGFPGETDELFEQTYAFLRDRIRPAFIHIFPYSRRVGTPAYSRRDQVQDSKKTERVKRLEELCRTLHTDFVRSCTGLHEKVLFESSNRDGKMYGYTGNYIRISRPYDPMLAGQITDVIIGEDEIALPEE